MKGRPDISGPLPAEAFPGSRWPWNRMEVEEVREIKGGEEIYKRARNSFYQYGLAHNMKFASCTFKGKLYVQRTK